MLKRHPVPVQQDRRLRRPVHQAGRQRHGDAAIALALAYHASRADPEIYEYQGRRAEAAARGWAERAEELDNDSSPERGLLPQLREKGWQ